MSSIFTNVKKDQFSKWIAIQIFQQNYFTQPSSKFIYKMNSSVSRISTGITLHGRILDRRKKSLFLSILQDRASAVAPDKQEFTKL